MFWNGWIRALWGGKAKWWEISCCVTHHVGEERKECFSFNFIYVFVYFVRAQ